MFTSLESAKRHLRIDGDADDAELAEKIAAAEQIACEYLNRKVFADKSEMDTAIAAVPAAILAAGAAYEAADTAANLIVDRLGVRVIRDNLTNKPFVSFYTVKRVGGGLLDPSYLRALNVAA